MNESRSLLGNGLGMVKHNGRYIFWFWLLNLLLAWFGASAFRTSAQAILDHSLYSDQLVHGFNLAAMIELFSKPEFGSMNAKGAPAVGFSILFFLATALFLPGVFMGYASTYRLPRDDFFRACGRNLWRFIRLMLIAGIIMGIFAAILFGIQSAIVKKAGESTNEVLPFQLQMAGLAVIFLIMTFFRIWFDLAEADTVLNDQRAVRKSIATAFRHTFRSLIRLLANYVVTAIVAAVVLVGGLWFWIRFVPSSSVAGAFLVSQITLFLLLIPRFWQRGIAVAYWQQKMLVPIVVTPPVIASEPVAVPPIPEPAAEPATTTPPLAPPTNEPLS